MTPDAHRTFDYVLTVLPLKHEALAAVARALHTLHEQDLAEFREELEFLFDVARLAEGQR